MLLSPLRPDCTLPMTDMLPTQKMMLQETKACVKRPPEPPERSASRPASAPRPFTPSSMRSSSPMNVPAARQTMRQSGSSVPMQ